MTKIASGGAGRVYTALYQESTVCVKVSTTLLFKYTLSLLALLLTLFLLLAWFPSFRFYSRALARPRTTRVRAQS